MQAKNFTVIQTPTTQPVGRSWVLYKGAYGGLCSDPCFAYAAADIVNLTASATNTRGKAFKGKSLNTSDNLLQGPDDPSTSEEDHINSALWMVSTYGEPATLVGDYAGARFKFSKRRAGEKDGLFNGVTW